MAFRSVVNPVPYYKCISNATVVSLYILGLSINELPIGLTVPFRRNPDFIVEKSYNPHSAIQIHGEVFDLDRVTEILDAYGTTHTLFLTRIISDHVPSVYL